MSEQRSRLVIEIDTRNAERNTKNLANELGSIEKRGEFASKSMDRMSVATRQLAGYMAGLVTVGAAISKMDAYSNMQNRLKLVTNSQTELNKAMGDTFAIAQKSYASWDSVVQVYQRFSDNAKTLKINMQQTAALTETVSKAVAISGASTQAAEAALTQFGQALASGVLRGEELNSILEQTPALAKAIAEGMGITVGQLRSVAAEGKITGDVLVDALTKSKASVDELFSKTDVTIGQSITLLSNEVTRFTGEAGKASGAASTLASGIQVLANNFNTFASIGIAVVIGAITTALARQTIALGASAIAWGAETKAVIANNGAKAASLTIGRSVLGVLGGPVGIGVTVASLAAGYLLMRDNTAEANAKLEEQAAVAQKTTNELLKLEGAQKTAAKQDLAEAFKVQNEELDRLGRTIGNTVAKISSKNTADLQTAKILREVRTGVMDYETAFKLLNKTQSASPEIITKLRREIDQYEQQRVKVQQNADAQKVLGVEVKLAGNAAQNAVGQHNAQAIALGGVEDAARGAAGALSEYAQQAMSAGRKAEITNTIMSKGYSQGVASDLAEIAAKNGKVTKEEAKAILYKHQQLNKLNATLEAQRKAEQAKTKAASAQSKAEKAALVQQRKDARESERIAEEQFRLREDIYYRYADRVMKIEKDLQNEIAEIQKANFANPKDAQGYIENAKQRAKLEKELYIAQLQEQYSAWQWNEEKKLDQKVLINELMIQLDADMNDDMKAQAMKSLTDQSNFELAAIKLAKEQRIFQANEAIYSEMELIRKRYDFERQEIMRIQDLEERSGLLSGSYIRQSQEEASLKDKALSDYSSVMGYEESPLVKQFEVLQKMRELDLLNEEAYQNAKLELQAKSTASYMEGMLGGFASLVDENSKTYAVLFAAQKAFAVAQAMLNIPAAYSKAYDAVVGTPYVGPYIAPAMGAAAAALQVAQAASIKSVNMQGFKSGGYTGNYGTSEVAGVVHGKEYVLNAEATKRVGINALNAINNGGSIQAEKQAQANAKVQGSQAPNVNLNPNFVIVDEREKLGDYLYSPDGKKAFVKFFKQNKRELGFA